MVLIQLCNNDWYTVKPQYINQIGGIFLTKSISIEKMTTLLRPNLYQIYAFSHRLYNKTFLQKQTTLLNNEPPMIIHNYKGAILAHKIDFRPKQPHRRCTIQALCTYAKNSNITVKEKPKLNNMDTCPCIEHTNEDLRKTKVKPLGIDNCQKNLEILLRSLGLFDQYKEVLNFCSIIALFSFDIETSFTKTIHPNIPSGIYSENQQDCGNIKGMLTKSVLFSGL